MLTCSTPHLTEIKGKSLPTNQTQGSTTEKSTPDLRAAATFKHQLYAESQKRHNTKKKIGTEDKVLEGIVSNSLFWHCRRSRSAVDKTTFTTLLWGEKKKDNTKMTTRKKKNKGYKRVF